MSKIDELTSFICGAFPKGDNDYTFKYPNISKSKNSDICRKMEIPEQTVIFAHMGRGRDMYTAITETGIHLRTEVSFFMIKSKLDKGCVSLSWEEIDHVDYSVDKKEFYIYTNDVYWIRGRWDFLGSGEDSTVCERIAESLTQCASIFKDTGSLAELFFKQLNDGDADNALETAEESIESSS